MLPQVGGSLEALSARTTAEGPLAFWLTLMVQELRRFLKVHLAQIALEKVFARMSVHVPHEVGAVLKALLAHSTFVRPLGAVRTLVMCQM